MVSYSQAPVKELVAPNGVICSFVFGNDQNIDQKTVQSFGEEWKSFHDFSAEEIEKIGQDYFDLLPEKSINYALDVGCGSGRWAKFLAPKVSWIEAIDPSDAVYVAQQLLAAEKNVRVTQASVTHLPFADNSFDLVYSLGVLHHVPNTNEAIERCFSKVKPGGYFLVYLYYNLDNRGALFKLIFKISNVFRLIISTLPSRIKKFTCDFIAGVVYWPLARISSVIAFFSEDWAKKIPLSYYRKTSFFVMRNDALDRFGTPLEKRFTKAEIEAMLINAGFININFSNREPYWHVIAQKP